MVVPAVRPAWTASLRSILVGVGVFLLGALSDLWLQQQRGTLILAILDDAFIGVAAGLLVFFYERRQNRAIIRKLEVVRLMNHHVRNSLQVISGAAAAHQREELAAQIDEAVERIEWALREVLPGQRTDIGQLYFDPQPKPPAPKPRVVA